MEKKKLDRKTLKYYAKMAAESYVDDPVHVYATKNETLRKKFLYHFMLERFSSSSGVDYIYEDEDKRGLCIFRDAHNDYTVLDFMKCPNWVFLCVYFVSTIKTLKAFSHRDMNIFEKGTYLIEPVFVAPEHQGQGIATKLIKQGIEELTAKGYKIGLETQNPDNIPFYEKLGFVLKADEFFKSEKIHNYCMVYQASNQSEH